MITAEFLTELNRFNLVIAKRVTSRFVGSRMSIRSGQGLTFEDHRIYVPGDDYRAIDWKIYGRTDKLHVRRYEEEKSLTVFTVTDSSGSMQYKKKWDYAAMLSVGFAYLTMRDNEKFQFATFSESFLPFRAFRGRNHLGRMIDHLNDLNVGGKSSFLPHVMKLNKMIHSRSLVVVISDFLYDIEEIKSGLLQLSKHDVKIIQLLDQDEVEMPYVGEFKLKDTETGGMLKTFVSNRFKQNYKANLKEHCDAIKNLCDKTGIQYILCNTGEDIFDIFYRALN